MKTIILSISFILIIGICQGQHMFLSHYKEAYALIQSDEELSMKYCVGDSLKLTLFPSFQYLPLAKFRNQLQELVDDKQLKKLMRYDKNQSKFQDKSSFKFMTDEFYRSLPSAENPCAFIAFNRMNEWLIVAEIIDYGGFGLDWKVLKSSTSTSHYILFDVRNDHVKHFIIEINR